MKETNIYLILLGCTLATAYELQGFRCSSTGLGNIEVDGKLASIKDICSDLSVSVTSDDGGITDSSSKLTVEHSASPYPGTGVEIWTGAGDTLLSEDLDLTDAIKDQLFTERMNSACGTSYLVASLTVKKDVVETVGFDVLPLKRACQDQPSLQLKVKTATEKPRVNQLVGGMTDPLTALGIEEISVVNGEDGTAMEKRWKEDVPEVVAFFLPLSDEILYTSFAEILEPFGVNVWSLVYNENGTNPWLRDQPEINQRIINLGLEDFNMFYSPYFMHNSSILSVEKQLETNSILDGVDVNGMLGKVDIASLTLPTSGYMGLLVVALDPTQSLNDKNRTDNVFVQFVTVNQTVWSEEPHCSAKSLDLGQSATVSYDYHGEDPQTLLVKNKGNKIVQVYGSKANRMKLDMQLSEMKSNKDAEYCKSLKSVSDNHVNSIVPVSEKLISMADKLMTNFDKVQSKDSENKTKLMRVMKLMKKSIELINEDTYLMKMVQKMMTFRKKRPQRPDYGYVRPQGYDDDYNHPSYNINGQPGNFHYDDYHDMYINYEESYDQIEVDYNMSNYDYGDLGNYTYSFNDSFSSGQGGIRNMGKTRDYDKENREYHGKTGRGQADTKRNQQREFGQVGKGGQREHNKMGQRDRDQFGQREHNKMGQRDKDQFGQNRQREHNKMGQRDRNQFGQNGQREHNKMGQRERDQFGKNGQREHNQMGNRDRDQFGHNGQKEHNKMGQRDRNQFGQNGQREHNRMGNRDRDQYEHNGQREHNRKGQGDRDQYQQSGRREDSSMGNGRQKPHMNHNGDQEKKYETEGKRQFGSQGNSMRDAGRKEGSMNNKPKLGNSGSSEFGQKKIPEADVQEIREALQFLKQSSFEEIHSEIKQIDRNILAAMLKSHKNDIMNIIYNRFSDDEVKEIEQLIAMKMEKGSGDNDEVNFEDLPLEQLPSFDSMTEDDLDEFIDEIDELANNEEDSEWSFWDSDDSFLRKKRSLDMKSFHNNKMSRKHSSMAKSLRKMIKMDDEKHVPRMFKDLSAFVKELIFAPNAPTTELGMRIPKEFRSEMREVLMMFMSDDMPDNMLNKLRGVIKFAYKNLSGKTMDILPITADDIDNVYKKISTKLVNKTQSEDIEEKKAWTMVKDVVKAADDDDIKGNLTNVLHQIQGVMVMKNRIPVMSGTLGDEPSIEDICQSYSNYLHSSNMKPMKKMDMTAVWKKNEEGIYKVELCPLTGKWYWTKVAMCSCNSNMPHF